MQIIVALFSSLLMEVNKDLSSGLTRRRDFSCNDLAVALDLDEVATTVYLLRGLPAPGDGVDLQIG